MNRSLPTRSARLVAPPGRVNTGIDGRPVPDPLTELDRRSLAACSAEDARVELRAAFDALEADGFRDLAALAADAISAVDKLRMELAS